MDKANLNYSDESKLESPSSSGNELDDIDETGDTSNNSNEIYLKSDSDVDYSEFEEGSDKTYQNNDSLHQFFIQAKDLLRFQPNELNTDVKQWPTDNTFEVALETVKTFRKEIIDGWVNYFQLWATEFDDDLMEFAINFHRK